MKNKLYLSYALSSAAFALAVLLLSGVVLFNPIETSLFWGRTALGTINVTMYLTVIAAYAFYMLRPRLTPQIKEWTDILLFVSLFSALITATLTTGYNQESWFLAFSWFVKNYGYMFGFVIGLSMASIMGGFQIFTASYDRAYVQEKGTNAKFRGLFAFVVKFAAIAISLFAVWRYCSHVVLLFALFGYALLFAATALFFKLTAKKSPLNPYAEARFASYSPKSKEEISRLYGEQYNGKKLKNAYIRMFSRAGYAPSKRDLRTVRNLISFFVLFIAIGIYGIIDNSEILFFPGAPIPGTVRGFQIAAIVAAILFILTLTRLIYAELLDVKKNILIEKNRKSAFGGGSLVYIVKSIFEVFALAMAVYYFCIVIYLPNMFIKELAFIAVGAVIYFVAVRLAKKSKKGDRSDVAAKGVYFFAVLLFLGCAALLLWDNLTNGYQYTGYVTAVDNFPFKFILSYWHAAAIGIVVGIVLSDKLHYSFGRTECFSPRNGRAAGISVAVFLIGLLTVGFGHALTLLNGAGGWPPTWEFKLFDIPFGRFFTVAFAAMFPIAFIVDILTNIYLLKKPKNAELADAPIEAAQNGGAVDTVQYGGIARNDVAPYGATYGAQYGSQYGLRQGSSYGSAPYGAQYGSPYGGAPNRAPYGSPYGGAQYGGSPYGGAQQVAAKCRAEQYAAQCCTEEVVAVKKSHALRTFGILLSCILLVASVPLAALLTRSGFSRDILAESDGYFIWAADSYEKVMPKAYVSKVGSKRVDAVTIDVARNEYGSLQLVWNTATEISELNASVYIKEKDGGAIISDASLRLAVTLYEETYPEILAPIDGQSLKKGENTSIWFSFFTDYDQKPGDYRAEIKFTFRAGADTALKEETVNVDISVAPYALPKTAHYFYNLPWDETQVTTDFYAKYKQYNDGSELIDSLHNRTAWYDDVKGEWDFDRPLTEAVIKKTLRDWGATVATGTDLWELWADIQTKALQGGRPDLLMPYISLLNIGSAENWTGETWSGGKWDAEDSKIIYDYYYFVNEFLISRDIGGGQTLADRAIIKWKDEWDQPQFYGKSSTGRVLDRDELYGIYALELAEMNRARANAVSDARTNAVKNADTTNGIRYLANVNPIADGMEPMFDYFDIYCPLSYAISKELTEYCRANGKAVWLYTCVQPFLPYANQFAYNQLYETHITQWQVYLTRTEGYWLWRSDYNGNSNYFYGFNGFFDGVFIYYENGEKPESLTAGSFMTGIRFETATESIEEVEYFIMLENILLDLKKSGKLSAKDADAYLAEMNKRVSSCSSSMSEWTASTKKMKQTMDWTRATLGELYSKYYSARPDDFTAVTEGKWNAGVNPF
ncbi:MAG: sulfur globule family protein [Clostridiales bacterium]|jgi:hypothetical protein|nr:sulfur globule family protein [Clostridiales bacterium]